jgi:hypothetical protein
LNIGNWTAGKTNWRGGAREADAEKEREMQKEREK